MFLLKRFPSYLTLCLTVIMLQLQEKLRCAVCLEEKWLTAKKQRRR